MPSERVLVCGAGVAGSILAYWLAKADYQVDVIERSKVNQKLGQGIEIENTAVKVVKMMGILDELKRNKTEETGFRLEDQKSRVYGHFGVGDSSPTGSLEMMRGDLTEILYKAADMSPNVTYRFQTTIQGVKQTADKTIVDLQSRIDNAVSTEEFDFVVGADGFKSRTRDLVMGLPEKLDCYKSVDASTAYFSIPKDAKDWPDSHLCHFNHRRIIWIRPTRKESDTSSVYLINVSPTSPELKKALATGDRMEQKKAYAKVFGGLGWETPRVLEHMMKTDNFYAEELRQVKLKTWSDRRVALVGDAAWAPTPFTGQGNQLAIIGAFVLAQEMARNRTPAAFKNYEKRFRGYAEECQQIPLGGWSPYLACPETLLGVYLLRLFLFALSLAIRFATWLKIPSLFPENTLDRFDLEAEESEKTSKAQNS